MRPPEVEIGVTVDFNKGESNPARVFHAITLILEGLEELDKIIVAAIDPDLRSSMILEDVESASITAWTKSKINQIDDEVLKSGDWKKAVGAVLLKAKYRAMKYLDEKESKEESKRLLGLRNDLQKLVESAPVRHIAIPAKIELAELVKPLDRIQEGKANLSAGDRLIFKSAEFEYESNIEITKKPSEYIAEAEGSEASGTMRMRLLIRRPDYLGETKWEFRHGKDTIAASILDREWMKRFKTGSITIAAGSALDCTVNYVHVYDKNGILLSVKHEIVEVFKVISPTHGPDEALPIK